MSETQDRVRQRVNRLATLLDGRYRIPGTSYRFGWDSLIGLIPGADVVTALPSLYILFQARRRKMPVGILLRMAGNLLLDLLVGLIPVIGDLFDVAFKSNLRNARLFEKGLERLDKKRGL